ncbi:MAG: acyl carrier protein [Candidatus Omnitrophota bacterium]|jgi:acyl carrier protein
MSIIDEIRELISEQIKMPLERIAPESRLIGDLYMDFVDLVRLAIDLEERYDIKISDEEVGIVETVGELVELVKVRRYVG